MGGVIDDDKMTVLDVIAAACAAALSGTGVGGGGLLVIYLSLIKGLPQLCCQGINLISFASSAAGAVPFRSKKRRVNARAVLMIGGVGALFSFFGYTLANLLDAGVLRTAFGAFLVFCGIKTLRRKN